MGGSFESSDAETIYSEQGYETVAICSVVEDDSDSDHNGGNCNDSDSSNSVRAASDNGSNSNDNHGSSESSISEEEEEDNQVYTEYEVDSDADRAAEVRKDDNDGNRSAESSDVQVSINISFHLLKSVQFCLCVEFWQISLRISSWPRRAALRLLACTPRSTSAGGGCPSSTRSGPGSLHLSQMKITFEVLLRSPWASLPFEMFLVASTPLMWPNLGWNTTLNAQFFLRKLWLILCANVALRKMRHSCPVFEL